MTAVDLGGTWIRAAVVSVDGACGPIARRPTQADRPPEEILADAAELIGEAQRLGVCPQAGSLGYGGLAVAIATVADPEGRIVPCPNLPTLGGLDMRRHWEDRLGLPAIVANDASCFALGEWWQGAGKGARDLCGITLGTGIGLGIVLAGRVYQGSHGCAGEIWKTPLVLSGAEGMEGSVLEDHVSAGAIERSYLRLSGRALPGIGIAALAEEGDATACQVFAGFGRSLGVVVSFLVNVLDPEVVVLGGSISHSLHHFRGPLAEVLATSTTMPGRLRLERSRLGDAAALLGAARLFWDRAGREAETG